MSSSKPNFIGFSSEFKAGNISAYSSLLDENKLKSQVQELKTTAIKNDLQPNVTLKIDSEVGRAIAALNDITPIERKMLTVLDAVKDISRAEFNDPEIISIIKDVTIDILDAAKGRVEIDIQNQLADIAEQIRI